MTEEELRQEPFNELKEYARKSKDPYALYEVAQRYLIKKGDVGIGADYLPDSYLNYGLAATYLFESAIRGNQKAVDEYFLLAKNPSAKIKNIDIENIYEFAKDEGMIIIPEGEALYSDIQIEHKKEEAKRKRAEEKKRKQEEKRKQEQEKAKRDSEIKMADNLLELLSLEDVSHTWSYINIMDTLGIDKEKIIEYLNKLTQKGDIKIEYQNETGFKLSYVNVSSR